MASSRREPEDLERELLPAQRGWGPLLERDYWAVIRGCRLRPSQIISHLARHFCKFPPPELVTFRHLPRDAGPRSSLPELLVGDELDVHIRLAGPCRVRVVSREPQTLTLATLEGHPEAGRITFGAYRNDLGAVIFHIRSRARSSTRIKYVGFLSAGEPMQTTTWIDFVKAAALTFGEGVLGHVHVETHIIRDEPDDPAIAFTPTYRAEGD